MTIPFNVLHVCVKRLHVSVHVNISFSIYEGLTVISSFSEESWTSSVYKKAMFSSLIILCPIFLYLIDSQDAQVPVNGQVETENKVEQSQNEQVSVMAVVHVFLASMYAQMYLCSNVTNSAQLFSLTLLFHSASTLTDIPLHAITGGMGLSH